MKKNLAYAVIWVAVSVAVICGMYFTKSLLCMWAFFMPVLFRVVSDDDD